MNVASRKIDQAEKFSTWKRSSMGIAEIHMKPLNDTTATIIDEKAGLSLGFLLTIAGVFGGSILSAIVFVLTLGSRVDTAQASANAALAQAQSNAAKIESRADISNTRYVELTNRMTNIETIVTRIDKKLDR